MSLWVAKHSFPMRGGPAEARERFAAEAGNWLWIRIFISSVTVQVRIHLSLSLKKLEERKIKPESERDKMLHLSSPVGKKKIDCMAAGSQCNIMLQNRTQPQELRGAYASHQHGLWLSIWKRTDTLINYLSSTKPPTITEMTESCASLPKMWW